MASQLPQPGDIVVVRTQDQDASLPETVLVARRDEPLQSDRTDLSNVVPFARPRRQGTVQEFPLPSVATDQRPAPLPPEFGLGRRIVLLVGSLALHSGLLAMFWQEPKPLASIGVEVMTIEVTLGATTAAGLAPMPGEQEVQALQPAEQAQPDEPEVQQEARTTTLMPQEVPVAAQEVAPEVKPLEQPPEVQTAEPRPQEPLPETETAVAEAPAETKPIENPPEQAVQPPPQLQSVRPEPERKRIAAPTEKKPAEKRRQSAATAPTDAASGIGRGRSDISANYNGTVAAHLSRYKRYPADARAAGSQGVASVSFVLDGDGRVMSVNLARGSGFASIDREVVAMVRRASPFPRPPDGRGRNFTVPVRFNLR